MSSKPSQIHLKGAFATVGEFGGGVGEAIASEDPLHMIGNHRSTLGVMPLPDNDAHMPQVGTGKKLSEHLVGLCLGVTMEVNHLVWGACVLVHSPIVQKMGRSVEKHPMGGVLSVREHIAHSTMLID